MNKLGSILGQQKIMSEQDWEELARSLGMISQDSDGGFRESVGYDTVGKALEKILGDSFFRSAVHAAITGICGGELALAILSLIRPPAAFDEIRQLLQEGADVETRRGCAWLMHHIGGREHLPDIGRFLDDEDEGVRKWAVYAIDLMLFKGRVEPEEIEIYLQAAENDQSADIREEAKTVRRRINENEY